MIIDKDKTQSINQIMVVSKKNNKAIKMIKHNVLQVTRSTKFFPISASPLYVSNM